MKIALLNENSQVTKNSIILESLTEVCNEKGYTCFNYGMTESNGSPSLTYVQLGLLAAILLNTKAVDFVITGCGTGQGAMLALNSFPQVLCGLITDPTDAYLFAQINDGNAISIPFAKGFGWGSELTLKNIFRTLFQEEFGNGYPKERAQKEQENKQLLDQVKSITTKKLIDILKEIDTSFLRDTINYDYFKKEFFLHSQDEEVNNYLKSILEK